MRPLIYATFTTLGEVSEWVRNYIASLKDYISENTVVVMDIDDTLIRPNHDICIRSMIAVYQECIKLNIPIYVITARPDVVLEDGTPNFEATLKTLQQCGITQIAGLQLMPVGKRPCTMRRVSSYKYNARKKLVESGKHILLNVGDQWTDMMELPETDETPPYLAMMMSKSPRNSYVGHFEKISSIGIKLPENDS